VYYLSGVIRNKNGNIANKKFKSNKMKTIDTLIVKFKKYSVTQLTKRAGGGKCSPDELEAISIILTKRNKEGKKFIATENGITELVEKKVEENDLSKKFIKDSFTKQIKKSLKKNDKSVIENIIEKFSVEFYASEINFDELYENIYAENEPFKETLKKEEPKKVSTTSVDLTESDVVKGLKLEDSVEISVSGNKVKAEVSRIYNYAKADMKEYCILKYPNPDKVGKFKKVCKSSASLLKGDTPKVDKKSSKKSDKEADKTPKKEISKEKLESPKTYIEIYDLACGEVVNRREETGKTPRQIEIIVNRTFVLIDRKKLGARSIESDYELEIITNK